MTSVRGREGRREKQVLIGGGQHKQANEEKEL